MERETRAVVGDVVDALAADTFAQLVASRRDRDTGTSVRNERPEHARLVRA